MPNSAHDMSLPTVLVDNITHGLTVNGNLFTFINIVFVKLLQCLIGINRVDTYKHIADHRFAWYHVRAVFASTTKIGARLGTQTPSPIRNRFVTSHPTQGCSSNNT
nr:MAG: hypothetical protein BECKH772C_GA0070978_106941 [Candidatus Kentron sp. H]